MKIETKYGMLFVTLAWTAFILLVFIGVFISGIAALSTFIGGLATLFLWNMGVAYAKDQKRRGRK